MPKATSVQRCRVNRDCAATIVHLHHESFARWAGKISFATMQSERIVSVRVRIRDVSRRTLGRGRCPAAVQTARSEKASAWCAAGPTKERMY